jgi:hypothetical protein
LRQDETGRWTSDDGRYLWDGTSWVDTQSAARADDAPIPHDSTPQGSSGHPSSEQGAGEPSTRTPGGGSAVPGAHSRRRTSRSKSTEGSAKSRRRIRSLVLLVVLLVLAAGGIGAVLLFGRDSTPTAAPAVTGSPSAASLPGAAAPAAPSSPVLDEQQRRLRAEQSLLQRGEIPGATEQRPANPTDVFLPCQAPALVPPTGTVIVGQTLGNTDFTTYVGQTVAGFPSEQAATDALASIRSVTASCKPYDFRYVNSDRFDRITHTDVDPALALGDGGVYLAEVVTPGNYNAAPITYSYGYVQQGQFLVRITLTNNSAADRPGLEVLVRRTLDRLR